MQHSLADRIRARTEQLGMTPAQLAQAIAPIYANDPDYAKQLVAIMSMLPVQAAIAKARSPQLQATATPPTPTSAA